MTCGSTTAKMMALGLLTQTLLAGADNGDARFINIEKLSDRVLLAYWVGTDRRCNLTAIQTHKGMVLIDTEMSPRIMAPIKQRIERVFRRNDWSYVINTHAHDSHAGGNALFRGATVVGHENLGADMQWLVRRQREPDSRNRELDRITRFVAHLRGLLRQGKTSTKQARFLDGEIRFWELHALDLSEGYDVVPPSQRFADQRILACGDLQLELVFFGKGHSASDILVYVPGEKLLVTGAIAYQRGHLPEISEASSMEDVSRAMAALDRFSAPDMNIQWVVPSHSPPLLKSDLPPLRDYYQRMLCGVRTAQQNGLTLEEARRRLTVSRNFPALRESPPGSWSYGTHDRNLRNLWRILKANASLQRPASACHPADWRSATSERGELEERVILTVGSR